MTTPYVVLCKADTIVAFTVGTELYLFRSTEAMNVTEAIEEFFHGTILQERVDDFVRFLIEKKKMVWLLQNRDYAYIPLSAYSLV